MREGWREVPLGTLIERRRDFTAVEPEDEYVILGVQRSGWGFVRREPIKGSDQKFTKLLRVEIDDLVYRTITAFEAPAAVATEDEEGLFVTPQTFPVFRIDREALLPRYMSLITTWPSFHEAMASRCTGTVLRRKTLSVSAFEAIPIPLPPLAEQRRIVDLIGALDDTIAAARVSIETQQALHRALRSELWGQGEITQLGSIGPALTGATPSTKEPAYWNEEEVPFVTPGDIGWDGTPIDDVARKASQVAASASKRVLHGVGVMQVCIGATAGKCGTIAGPVLFNQQINCITGLSQSDATVLAALLASPQFQAMFRQTAGSSTMPLVSKTRWSQMEVAWPSADFRLAAAQRLDACAGVLHSAEYEVEQLEALRSDLLTALLSGEHEIPESYDELMDGAA